MVALKLVGHAFRGRSRRFTFDPIGGGLRVARQPQRIFAEQAQQESHRSYHQIKQKSGDDGRDYAAEQQAEPGPDAIQRVQPGWSYRGYG